MRPFFVQFAPSRHARIALAMLHGVSLYLLWQSFRGWQQAGLMALLLVSFAYTQYLYSASYVRRVVRLEIRPDGRAVLFFSRGEGVPARALAGSLVSRRALLIRWQLDEDQKRIIRQAVLPEMTGRDAYRRLCVWLRYGQEDV